MTKYDKNRINIYIPYDLKKKAKKQGINLSRFFTEMLERELAGEFNPLKIDGLKKEINLLESQTVKIKTKQHEQKKRADDTYNQIVDEQLRERRALNRQRRKKPRGEQ